MRVDSRELQLSVSCFHVILGLPGSRFPSTCMSQSVLTAPLEHSTSFRMRSRASMPNSASSSGLDGDSILQHDIADLSDRCPAILLQLLEVWLCQWPSLSGMEHCAPHTRAVHAATCLEREVAGREN